MIDHGQTNATESNPRLALIVRTLGFQFRLLGDGLRDLLLSPLSLAATALGLCFGGNRPDRYFNQLMGLGRRSEEWINLFGRYRDDAGETLDAWEARILREIETRAQEVPQLRDVGRVLNGALDQVNTLSASKKTGEPPRSTD